MMNLALEISTLESTLEDQRQELRILREHKIVSDFELDQLRRALVRAQAERDHHMTKKAELKTILDQAGAHLVAGVQRYHEQNREEQHAELAAGEPAPQFLTQMPENKL